MNHSSAIRAHEHPSNCPLVNAASADQRFGCLQWEHLRPMLGGSKKMRPWARSNTSKHCKGSEVSAHLNKEVVKACNQTDLELLNLFFLFWWWSTSCWSLEFFHRISWCPLPSRWRACPGAAAAPSPPSHCVTSSKQSSSVGVEFTTVSNQPTIGLLSFKKQKEFTM